MAGGESSDFKADGLVWDGGEVKFSGSGGQDDSLGAPYHWKVSGSAPFFIKN